MRPMLFAIVTGIAIFTRGGVSDAQTLQNLESKAANALGAGPASTTGVLSKLQADSHELQQLGKLGEQKASSAAVKDYAKSLVSSAQSASQKVSAAAKDQGSALPSSNGTAQGIMQKLRGLSGSSFDKAFLEQAIETHLKGLTTLRTAGQSSNGTVQSLAQKLLPSFQRTLSGARALLDRL